MICLICVIGIYVISILFDLAQTSNNQISLLLFQGFQPFLNNSHYDKPATHCPCLQIGVGAEHSLLLLQPEEELFLEMFPKETKEIKKPPKKLKFKKKKLDIISNLCQHISHYVDHSVLPEACILSPCNRDILK